MSPPVRPWYACSGDPCTCPKPLPAIVRPKDVSVPVADVLREWIYDRDRAALPETPGEVADRVIVALYAAGWRVVRDRS